MTSTLILYPLHFRRASNARTGVSSPTRAEAVVPTTGTAIQAAHDVNNRPACDMTRRSGLMDTSGRQTKPLHLACALLSAGAADRPGPSVVSLRDRRHVGRESNVNGKGTYRKTPDGTGRAGTLATVDQECAAIHLDRPACSHPTTGLRMRAVTSMHQQAPIAIKDSGPPPRMRTTTMAQRDSFIVQFSDRLHGIKRHRIVAAQHPESPGGVHITADEHADISEIDSAERDYNRWLAWKQWLDKAERLGMDAPTVQRGLRELMRDFSPQAIEHEPEGMRR